jgi:CubicO group peptidase (beta-lactamase class C family)
MDRIHAPTEPAGARLRRDDLAQPAYGGPRNELFAEQGPKDAFGLVGHLGQYVIVVPSKGLTVVRLGKTDGPERPALVHALAEIVALYPSR